MAVPFVATQVIAASITHVGGDSGLDLGDGEIPVEGDVKIITPNIWDDEW